MAYLLDTGVLLRLVNSQDGHHLMINGAVRELVTRQEHLHITNQNVAEFLNVATRPIANNGFGWSSDQALDALSVEIDPFCSTLLETSDLQTHLRRLVKTYIVMGKQVHDARLVAMMLSWKVKNILTLNEQDFRRYRSEGITVVTPPSLIGLP
jgi:predicted nucleic acid-binding protein